MAAAASSRNRPLATLSGLPGPMACSAESRAASWGLIGAVRGRRLLAAVGEAAGCNLGVCACGAVAGRCVALQEQL